MTNSIIETAQRVLEIESNALAAMVKHIDGDFTKAVEIILNAQGRVIVTGLGKSGIIGKKISATLTSTGTPAFFLHPVEAIHGDVGMVLKDDVVICLSNSGNTDEISQLFPVFKKIGVPIIAMTGNAKSALAERADAFLNTSVEIEACPHNLAPTASTTAMLAMGDALAVALLEQREFDKKDFASLHPGGSLGKKLVRVEELMFTGEKVPVVHSTATLNQTILEITKKRFGGTCVVDPVGHLLGIITDGDLRRLMQPQTDFVAIKAQDIMNPTPKTISVGCYASEALQLMENFNILQIVVIDEENVVQGMIHLHDLLEAGIKNS